MKAFHNALIAAVLLVPAGGALAVEDESNAMESGKTGSANTQENSLKPQGGSAGEGGAGQVEGEPATGPDESMSTQTGTANTEVGSTKPQGGSAGEGGTGQVEGNPATGPDESMSTQTGSANTEVGSTKPQGGTATD